MISQVFLRNHYFSPNYHLLELLKPLLFLILSRVFVVGIAYIATSFVSPAEGYPFIENAFSISGALVRWDSGYYLQVASQGYSLHGDEVNFFPGYPIVIWLLSFGYTPLMQWIGLLVSNIAYVWAGLLLWRIVEQTYNQSIAWATIITLSIFPTSFFFSALYSESLFLLFSILVYWYSRRRKYFLSAIFVSLASVTRIYGILLLLIPMVAILQNKLPNMWRAFSLTSFVSSISLAIYGSYLWLTQGSPIAFVLTQQKNMNRSITWPGLPLLNAMGVVVSGYGGFQENWFMRVVSLQDLLAILLFVGCTIGGFFLLKEKSLTIYLFIAVLVLSMSHGPQTLGSFDI